MDKLDKFFDNVDKIREILERKEQGGAVQNCSKPINNMVASVPTPTVAIPTETAIPTTSESFTQEQIAKAMSNAQAAGKIDLIQKILATFNANCLMAIDASNYNQIAVMLREAGIQV